MTRTALVNAAAAATVAAATANAATPPPPPLGAAPFQNINYFHWRRGNESSRTLPLKAFRAEESRASKEEEGEEEE